MGHDYPLNGEFLMGHKDSDLFTAFLWPMKCILLLVL